MAAFVACAARSGSTLLRFLVDAHPDLACPAETDLAVLVEQHARIGAGLLGDEAAAHRRARAVADDLMAAFLRRSGKSSWLDKSLSNVFHLDLLARLWPEARFVLLHRHCMDMVLSGLEASPWGLAEYGFAQVAQRSPTDSVVALAAYWADRTARMLDFEAREPERTLRVRYEDLVTRTGEVLEAIFAHLGVRAPAATAALGSGTSGHGPADHTIWYTDAVHANAVGRGARVPPDHVQGPLREHVNGLLEQLGYATVDDAWGSGGHDGAPGDDRGAWPGPGEVELRVVDGHRVLAAEAVRGGADGPARGSRAGAVVTVERGALGDLATGEQNLGSALRSRLVRYYGPPLSDFSAERAVFRLVHAHLRARGPALARAAGTG